MERVYQSRENDRRIDAVDTAISIDVVLGNLSVGLVDCLDDVECEKQRLVLADSTVMIGIRKRLHLVDVRCAHGRRCAVTGKICFDTANR